MENEPLPLALSEVEGRTPRKLKRKPGGQKGNQNARKHGFYSRTLTLAEMSRFRDITALEGIDPEIALLRVKLQSLFQNDPGNRRALGEASNLLARCLRIRHGLDATDTACLKMFIESFLEQYASASSFPSDLPAGIDRRH